MRNQITTVREPIELKGSVIPDTAIIVERLADAIDKLEAGVAAREAEVVRLRAIADAAQAALAELDAFISDVDDTRAGPPQALRDSAREKAPRDPAREKALRDPAREKAPREKATG